MEKFIIEYNHIANDRPERFIVTAKSRQAAVHLFVLDRGEFFSNSFVIKFFPLSGEIDTSVESESNG